MDAEQIGYLVTAIVTLIGAAAAYLKARTTAGALDDHLMDEHSSIADYTPPKGT